MDAKSPTLFISWSDPRTRTGSAVLVRNLALRFSRSEMQIVSEVAGSADLAPWPPDAPQIHSIDPFVPGVGRGRSTARWLRVGGVVEQVKDIARRMRAGRVLALFPDDYHLYVGYRCSKALGIPLYTWFHNTYLDAKRGYRRVLAGALQPAVFGRSRLNMVMSDGMLHFMTRRYPGSRFATLQHGFPLEPVDAGAAAPRIDRTRGGRISFCFTGNLNRSCEDATRRLVSVLASRPDFELHVYLIGGFGPWRRLGVDCSRISFHEPVGTLERFVRVLGEYDVLLLPLGLTGPMPAAEYRTMFPTRTIPLLASGRPVLAHVPPDSFLARYLREHDCAFVADQPDERLLLATIDSMLTDLDGCRAKVANAIAASGYFDVAGVSQRLRSLISEHERPAGSPLDSEG